MFSSFSNTNEDNPSLIQDQIRVSEYVESTIPQSVLDAGTSVMTMQVSCTTPNCAPLETVIVIVFPKVLQQEYEEEWISKLLISTGQDRAKSNHFQTRIYLPIHQVTRDHVLDTLPPIFQGGRKTKEREYIKIRDQMILQIEQIMGDSLSMTSSSSSSSSSDTPEIQKQREQEGKVLLAKYLIECLNEYIDNDCIAFQSSSSSLSTSLYLPTKDRSLDDNNHHQQQEQQQQQQGTTTLEVIQGNIQGSGNFVIRRKKDDELERSPHPTMSSSTKQQQTDIQSSSSSLFSMHTTKEIQTYNNNNIMENTMDWRRRQSMEKSVMVSLSSSTSILEKLSERDHAPGIRKQGCPCCEPDNISNIVDQMLSM